MSGLLNLQKKKLERDYSFVHDAFPEISRQDYTYNWLLVNTRTFYHLLTADTRKKGRQRRLPPVARDDCMALCPLADCFNHSDEGVSRPVYLRYDVR